MEIVLKDIERKDEKKAMAFAAKGMHFERYIENRLEMKLYSRYFWYLEKGRASQCIAAYADGRFSGVLLAEIYGEPKPYRSFWRSLYVRFVDWVQDTFFKGGTGGYNEANKKMMESYRKTHQPDGELVFLAADPDHPIKGLGTKLLRELERREHGKLICLYTDDGCTWQFYEHRGFERVGEEPVTLMFGEKQVPMLCLLYSKRLNTPGEN